MTALASRPCSSSTNESIVPAQSRQMACQRFAFTGAMLAFTL
jgi:hypothetical protein